MATLKNTKIDDTGFIRLPSGTVLQRPSSPSAGMIRYNSAGISEYYNGSTWVEATSDLHPANIVTSDLILHFDADNKSSYPGSGSIVTDLSNNGGVGEIVGTSFDQNTQSFSFNNGDRIGFGIDGGTLEATPGITNELSVCAWINPSNPSDNRAPITRIDRWYFQVYDQNNLATYWYGRSPSGYHYSTSNSIPMNQWSFASVVWSTNDIKFYINGVLDNTITNVGGTGDQNDYIRVGYENSSREYEGNIGHVAVYNKELSETEVQQNFDALRDRYGL